MAAHFEKEIHLHFREADPAGIMFFGNVFNLAHDCFEDFIQAAGLTWQDWFHTKNYHIPIRHTECNFLNPFFPGKIYVIRASVTKIGDSSFQMKYVFFESGNSKKICAEVLMVHTYLDARTKKKTSVPDDIRQKFAIYLETPNAQKK